MSSASALFISIARRDPLLNLKQPRNAARHLFHLIFKVPPHPQARFWLLAF